jgi:hypothetical protein
MSNLTLQEALWAIVRVSQLADLSFSVPDIKLTSRGHVADDEFPHCLPAID